MSLKNFRRDIRVFKYLFEHKVASATQINRDIFSDCHLQSTYRVLRRLKRDKFILPKGEFISGKMLCLLTLGEKGLDSLKHHYPYEIDQPVLKSDSIKHDLTLTNLVQTLKRFDFVESTICENVLRSCSELASESKVRPFVWLRSDAYLKLSSNGADSHVALEYDQHEKSPKRYRQKFQDYYDQKKVNAVFYIIESKAILNRLMTIDKEVCQQNNPKFYFALKDDVIKSDGIIIFINSSGGTFKLK